MRSSLRTCIGSLRSQTMQKELPSSSLEGAIRPSHPSLECHGISDDLTSVRTSASKLSSSMKISLHLGYGVTVSTYGKLDSISSTIHSPLRYTDVSSTTLITLPHSSLISFPVPPVRSSAR